MTTFTGSASLHAGTTFLANTIVLGVTNYYIPESLPVGATASRYVTEDGLGFYVAEIGREIIIFNNTTTLAATGDIVKRSTAQFSDSAVLTVQAVEQMVADAAFVDETILSASGIVGAILFFTGGPILSVSADLLLVASTLLSAETNLNADGFRHRFILPGEILLSIEAILGANGEIVQFYPDSASFLSEAVFTCSAILSPPIPGHALIYIVDAPEEVDLTSDPVIGPLLQGNSSISGYHTFVDSVTAFPGSWHVILLFNQPLNTELVASPKCSLIYDITALINRSHYPPDRIIFKNTLGNLDDLEIIVDGFGTLVNPGMLEGL